MKIVVSSAGKDWRGTDNVTWTLVTGLRRRGHDLLVLCRPDSVLRDRLAEAQIPYAAILSGLDLSPATLWRCARTLKRFGAQIVITLKDKDLRQSAVAARMIGVPVLVCHGTDRPLKNNARYRFFFDRVATDHVAVSQAVRTTIKNTALWLKSDIAVIYNGIETGEIESAKPAQLDLPAGAVSVGFVGHFEGRKGFKDFAQAWWQVVERAPHAHAIIVGQGRREPDFRAALADAPRVHWLGFRSDVPAIMQALDIFVLPSRFEGFGLVLVEAMTASAACVTYDSSNMPELIDHERNGLLVPLGDIKALADAIVRVCNDAVLRERLGAAAHATVLERFSGERMVADYEALIAGIVA
ncbi:MAG TPA: glycosyltransferase family 4 protein [Longimicrobiales bacterium]|nr:glycosyltransferase family 4 protein [Longimicrobiales bacterium]